MNTNLSAIAFACGLVALSAACSGGDEPAQAPVEPATVEIQGPTLSVVHELLNRDLVTSPTLLAPIGLESPEEATRASVGRMLPVFLVRLDQLASYEGGDPGSLLTDIDTQIGLLQVDGETRSLVVVENHEGQSRVVKAGGASYARMLDATIESAASTDDNLDPTQLFVVEVKALNLAYIGYRSDDKTVLIPVQQEDVLGHEARVAHEAGELFLSLVPEAKSALEFDQRGDGP